MTRLLILDLDGTLVDSFAVIEHGIATALRAIDVEPSAELRAMCRRGWSLQAFYLRAVGRDPDGDGERARFGAFVDSYRATYAEVQGESRPFPGVVDTLAAVRAARPDLRVAVATAKRTDMAEAVVGCCGLAGYVDAVAGCDGLPSKPDPAVLRRAAERAGAELPGALMVGDTDHDVGAARAAGIRSCAVTYGGWSRAELEALPPDRMPHHIIDRFAELVDVLDRG